MSELFYVFGIGLTLLAFLVAFGGMRMEKFPSPMAFRVGLAVMGVFVVGASAFAIVLSREEKEERVEEIEAFRAEEEAAAEEGQASESDEPSDVEPVEEEALALTSPDAGDLIFDPTTLEAVAGAVTINYTNPSEVPHNVAIEDGSETVAQGETVTGGDSAPATADLDPGEYVYYCSIPGHRESGMEGSLTVE